MRRPAILAGIAHCQSTCPSVTALLSHVAVTPSFDL